MQMMTNVRNSYQVCRVSHADNSYTDTRRTLQGEEHNIHDSKRQDQNNCR